MPLAHTNLHILILLYRLGIIDNEIIINPTRKDLEKSSLNLIVTATKGNLVVMLEGGAQDILQQDLLKAIKLGKVSSTFFNTFKFYYNTIINTNIAAPLDSS